LGFLPWLAFFLVDSFRFVVRFDTGGSVVGAAGCAATTAGATAGRVTMAWLLRRGEVLASLEVASGPFARVRGFAGRDRHDAALLLRPMRIPHTVGVRTAVDVAYLDADLVVVSTSRLSPFRVGLPRRRAHAVLEADAGAFERWQLRCGDHLEIEA
jgi:hypothetical protein